MNKPAMMMKWSDEKNARPILRSAAAEVIRKNRSRDRILRDVKVQRTSKGTNISSHSANVSCVIFKAGK